MRFGGRVARMPTIVRLWRREFAGYSAPTFRADLIAGLTVAAVALPLALAFGVASGATAAAGLVTAVVAGLVIGVLSGAPYQISGPTGAMSAVLVVIVAQYGLRGLWLATLMAGAMVLALGLFRLGRVVNLIPAPVITGFTSGIAVIIAVGQIDNFFGIGTPAAESAALKLLGYATHPLPAVGPYAVACGLLVIAVMLLVPRVPLPGAKLVPAALLGVALVTTMSLLAGWDVTRIGAIPGTLILDDRYMFRSEDLPTFADLLAPAVVIAALGAIESLLAGSVAGRMTGVKLDTNQELIAQGVGNLLLPFVGGVPATAAIARMSVGVKAGGVTRLVGIIHALVLLVVALFLGGVIGQIPLAALAAVLMVTAVRMNEWHRIRFYVQQQLTSSVVVMLATMAATIALDLTKAIVVGVVVSLLFFVRQVSRLDVVVTDVDPERLGPGTGTAGSAGAGRHGGIKVVYISGALFFGASSELAERLERQTGGCRALILSMRGVPVMDASGVHAIEEVHERQQAAGGVLYITGLQPGVRDLFDRAGLTESIGPAHFFWGADQAIHHAAALSLDADAEPESGRHAAD